MRSNVCELTRAGRPLAETETARWCTVGRQQQLYRWVRERVRAIWASPDSAGRSPDHKASYYAALRGFAPYLDSEVARADSTGDQECPGQTRKQRLARSEGREPVSGESDRGRKTQ